MIRSRHRLLFSWTFAIYLTGWPLARAAPPVPKAARLVIQRLRRAAREHDIDTLRANMVPQFTWSFGGDDDREQALEEWARDKHFLRGLDRVLGMKCVVRDADHVDCPGRRDLSFRAGLLRLGPFWKLEFFVEGD